MQVGIFNLERTKKKKTGKEGKLVEIQKAEKERSLIEVTVKIGLKRIKI